MLSRALPLTAVFCLLWAASASAAVTHYVDINSPGPMPPFTSWATAATNIQDAIDTASSGDQVIVTNGVYNSGGRTTSDGVSNRMVVTNVLTVQSVNGPSVTLIDGGKTVRCAYLTTGVWFSGFTLTNGHAAYNGGGVWCQSTNVFVSNCLLISNSISGNGGGVYSGTLNNCVLMGNLTAGGGVGGGAFASVMNNCLVVSNSAFQGGGAYEAVMNNCTVAANSAQNNGGGTAHGIYDNCIIYYNTGSGTGSNYGFDLTLTNCCTAPLASNFVNITNAPLFVNRAGGDFHLQSGSPCINAGNNSFVTNTTDLDGNPRFSGGTVDMGAYEFQNPASVISYAWLLQYSLGTDGSADFSDPDLDGMNNYDEWRAGTNPTNAASVLILSSPTMSGTNIVVTWQSVTNRTYYLQRSIGLGAQPAFLPLATNLAGHAGTTSYTDTNSANSGSFFYRVGVQ